MTILPFPSKRDQLERLAAELGATIVWQSHRKTARDCVLEVLGCRVALTTAQIAAATNYNPDYILQTLSALKREGLVLRQASRRYGGWLLQDSAEHAA